MQAAEPQGQRMEKPSARNFKDQEPDNQSNVHAIPLRGTGQWMETWGMGRSSSMG